MTEPAIELKLDPDKCVAKQLGLSCSAEELFPQELLDWLFWRFPPERVWVASSFGKDSTVLLHMLKELHFLHKAQIFWINTGYDFPETLELRDRLTREWGFEVHEIRPPHTVEEFEEQYGKELYRTDPELCCYLNKVQPMIDFFRKNQIAVWVSALRRDESPTRRNIRIFEAEAGGRRLKVNPLANWTRDQIWGYLWRRQVPYNPLYDQGYPSLGCRPCTEAHTVGRFEQSDERAGRWAGTAKAGGECGIHTQRGESQSQGQGQRQGQEQEQEQEQEQGHSPPGPG